jgi:glycosyltransferase involved in cell wall biosynthesis
MHSKNRVLFFIASLAGGGAERVLATLANAFASQGKQVFIATYSPKDSAYDLLPDIQRMIVLDEKTPKKKRSILSKIHWRWWKFRKIRTITKTVSPDVVVSFVTPTNNDVLFSLLGLSIPIVVCEHTNVLRSYSKTTSFYRKLMYPFASAITVLTRHDYNLWKHKYRNVVYMPNPIELNQLENHSNMERNKVVLAAGTIISWKIKGFDNLLRCWGKLCHRFPDWTLCIAGKEDDNSMHLLHNIIKDCDCENVVFLGFRRDVREIMRSSAIFCLSSRVEGLPMVLIEAMEAGCCCVAFDCKTGPREIIKENCGVLVEDQNIKDLEDKLSMVMSNDQLRNRYSINAPKSIHGYSIDNILSRWQILFSKI